MYLGRWHHADVAVKCLNPAAFLNSGNGSDVAAMADLVREADLLGSFRHPNIVWIYGMVLARPCAQGPARHRR